MIDNKKYVDVVTNYISFGGASRSYHARIFSQNAVLQTKNVTQFLNLVDVGDFFGTSSLEYLQAQRYFTYTSPVGRSPQLIEFYKYSPSGANAFVFGNGLTNTNLTAIQAITNGSLTLTFNGVLDELTALDFSPALTWQQVATILQTAWTVQKGTVTFNIDRQALVFTTSTSGVSTVIAPTGDIAIISNLGLVLPIISFGSAIETITECFSSSIDLSDNFGGFTFNGLIIDTDIVEASALANSPRADYLYSFEQTTNAFTIMDLIQGNEGTCANFDNLQQNTSICPLAIFASTDYTVENGIQGFMFRTFSGMIPVVSETTTALELDAKKVNYYGTTSRSGARFSFYQNGFTTGEATYLEVYTGSIHVKQTIVQALIELEISSMLIPIGIEGESIVTSVISSKCADFSSVGIIKSRVLTNGEESTIISNYGKQALDEIKNIGYSVQATTQGTTIKYTLIYLSVVGVRKIEGSHTVIGA